jgi:hypothetical protein
MTTSPASAVRYETVEYSYTEYVKQPGGKPPKSVRKKKTTRALVVESKEELSSICMKEKGLPEAIALRHGLGAKEKSIVIAREDILSVNRQIIKEKKLSDEASKKPLRAVYIDDLLTTEVNDNCTGTLARGTTGCGKCWAPETPMLMFDGSVKAVGDMRPGDTLMGPDGSPRTILSTNTGRDEMFRIVGSDGSGFVCNSEHILVLRADKAGHDKEAHGGVLPQLGKLTHSGDLEIPLNVLLSARSGAESWRVSRGWKMFRVSPESVGLKPDFHAAAVAGEYEWKVIPLGVGDFAGFTLTGDGQCLLGDLTVTHNTACVGNMLVHQAYRHQCGIIHDSWWTSMSFIQSFAIQLELERQASDIVDEISKVGEERETLERATLDMRDEYLSHQRFQKYYEFELGELNTRLTVRLRELRRQQSRQATGILALAGMGSHRPRPFVTIHPVTKTEESLKSAYEVGLSRALAPATTYDRYTSSRPLLRDWHAGVKTQSATANNRWADADSEVTELRAQMAGIEIKANAARAEVERMQPQYDTYLRKRSDYMEKANRQGFALTKLTRKARVLCFNKDTLELKYKRMPFGGLLIDQKGSYNEVVAGISKAYGKLALLTLIQVRPSWAKSEKDRHLWTPLVKWNLLSMPRNLISPAAYAEIFASTGASFKGSGGGGGDKNDYFVKAGQNFIKVGIELGFEACAYEFKMAKRAAEKESDRTPVREKIPSLQEIYRFLTDQQRTFYLAFLDRYGLKELVEKQGKDALAKLANLKRTVTMLEDLRKEGNYTEERAAELIGPSLDGAKFRVEFLTTPLIACMEEMETFFSYDKGQLSGLTGTIQNTLNPYVSDDMAEIFCAQDNTVDISDIDYGVVFCLAMSQKFAEERKYICVLLKKLIYFWNRLRNDLPGWDLEKYQYKLHGNGHYVFQDECQDTVTDDDQEIDKFRSQGMCAVFLTQSIVALYQRLGGKERAQAFFNNINNLYIGTAGDKDCAEISAEALGRFMAADYSYNRQRGQLLDLGGVSFSEKERFIIRPHEIRALPKFTFIVALKSQSSERGAAVRRFLIGPRDRSGDKPTHWWPATLKQRDWWLNLKCQWNDEYPEFNRLPLGFNIKPVA